MEIQTRLLTAVAPVEALKKMRRAQQLYPRFERGPVSVAGLEVSYVGGPIGDVMDDKQGKVLGTSNKPAMQTLLRGFKPEDFYTLVRERLKRGKGYPAALRNWEGDWESILRPRGPVVWHNILEQILRMGPKGTDLKRGADDQYDYTLLAKASNIVASKMLGSFGRVLQPYHMVITTPGSHPGGIGMSHTLPKSAGTPHVYRTDRKSAKKYHVKDALELAFSFSDPKSKSFPLHKGVAYRRGDRDHEYSHVMLNNPDALEQLAIHGRDRLIVAMPFSTQLMDAAVTQPIMHAFAASDLGEIDMRAPWNLADHARNGQELMKRLGKRAFSIGADESHWDQSMHPQLFWAIYKVYKRLLPETMDQLLVESNFAVKLRPGDMDRFQSLKPGQTTEAEFVCVIGDQEKIRTLKVRRHVISMDRYLRRLFAGVTGRDIHFGKLLISGFKQLLNPPDGKQFQSGWGMASGNYGTFMMNSIGNWVKAWYIHLASKDAASLDAFKQRFGYTPPAMDLKWYVCRGDDSGAIWVIDDVRTGSQGDWKISELVADWLTFLGGKASAKKQHATDERGAWEISFAQILFSDDFPNGVKSVVRLMSRFLWDEEDKYVTKDPESGESLEASIPLAASYGKLQDMFGIWAMDPHPLRLEVLSLLQELDTTDRMLPPINPEDRAKLARVTLYRLINEGRMSARQLDEGLNLYWATELADKAEQLYNEKPVLENRKWTPIQQYFDAKGYPDARDVWRVGQVPGPAQSV